MGAFNQEKEGLLRDCEIRWIVCSSNPAGHEGGGDHVADGGAAAQVQHCGLTVGGQQPGRVLREHCVQEPGPVRPHSLGPGVQIRLGIVVIEVLMQVCQLHRVRHCDIVCGLC